MAKRFTDTEKWKKPFVKSLQTVHKLLWMYILDECDHAGIWHVEIDVAGIRIGEEINIDDAIKDFGDHIVPIDNGQKWFIPDFIRFQYGELNPSVKAHNSVISILKKYDLLKTFKGFVNSLETVMDKDKDKDIMEGGVGETKIATINGRHFAKIWEKLPPPMKIGKKLAETHFKTSVKTEEDWQLILKALDKYVDSERFKRGVVQNGSTWFNNWRDWLDYQEPESSPELDPLDEKRWRNIRQNIEKLIQGGCSVDDAIKKSKVVERWHDKIRMEFV